jgi:type IV pilus biogenesis protein CpaD/CtpE
LTRAIILLALLAGCSTAPPPDFPACPDRVAIPAPLHKGENVGKLEIRVELWAEKLLARGDACQVAVDARDAWINRQR